MHLRLLSIFAVVFLFLGAAGLGSCQAPAQPLDRGVDQELRATIAELGLTGDPASGRDLPSIDDPLAQLGMKLFFSKTLGGDMDTACASCHHPLLGGGDGLPLSIGVGAVDPDVLGPGRMHPDGPLVARNAPTTFNAGLWDQMQFHDGRIESLGKTPGMNGGDGLGIRTPDTHYGEADPEAGPNLPAAQSLFPLTSDVEMRGDVFEAHRSNRRAREQLVQRLREMGGWEVEFAKAFGAAEEGGELITVANITAALGAYERSQVFVDTPWRAYVAGDDRAISPAARQGALLFFRSIEKGGAGCARCHSGDFFTDEDFYVLAIPQIGAGKEDGRFNDDDFGRFRETGDPADLYAFRTPTLLNVEVTGPYGHDGAYATLEEIISHHLDPASAAEYDVGALDPMIEAEHTRENTARALAQLHLLQTTDETAIQKVELSSFQVNQLVAFLKTLTDPCVKDPACLSPWIPDASDPDPDGLRLRTRIPSLIDECVDSPDVLC